MSTYEKIADSLWRNTQTGVIYVRKTFRGRGLPDLFASTKTAKVNEAKREAMAMIAAHVARHESAATLTVGKVIDEVLETVTPYRRKGTQEQHQIYLGELKAEWGNEPLDKVTLASWNKWLVRYRARKKRKTFADYAKNMNLVLRYAYRQKYAEHLVVLPNPDVNLDKAGRVFSHDEIAKLWAVMTEETRDQFVLCYECIMRLREALYLTWDRVDLDSGEITLRPQDVKTGSKTGKGRTFKMSPTALQRLRERAKWCAPRSRFVFPSPGNPERPTHSNKTAWNVAKAKAGIVGKARWHDLRHTALSRALLEAKAEPALVSEYSGVSLRTLQRVYLHSTAEQTAPVALALSVHKKCEPAPKGRGSHESNQSKKRGKTCLKRTKLTR